MEETVAPSPPKAAPAQSSLPKAPQGKPASRTLTFVSDDGHGWLEVELRDLRALGIAKEITSYSYMTTKSAFLEEDSDAGVFIKAAESAGWKLKIDQRRVDGRAPLREYSSFKQEWVERPMEVGAKARLTNGLKVEVASIKGKSMVLRDERGFEFGASTTSVLGRVYSEREWEERVEAMKMPHLRMPAQGLSM